MESRGFKSIGKTKNVIHVFDEYTINRLFRFNNLRDIIKSNVVLGDTPYILLRQRLYNERRRYFEQKQKSENCIIR